MTQRHEVGAWENTNTQRTERRVGHEEDEDDEP